jgi:hypothetical protein
MIVEINTEILVEKLLNPTEYVYLYCIYLEDYTTGNSIAVIDGKVQLDPAKLEKVGWIKLTGPNIEDVELREIGIELFEASEKAKELMWAEFKSRYPRKDGVRQLHDQQEKCKAKYISYLSKKGTHQIILSGLANEMEARQEALKRREFFPAPKTMSAWLNQKHWLTYLDKVESQPSNSTGNTEAI